MWKNGAVIAFLSPLAAAAAVLSSRPPYAAIAVPIILAVAVAFWVARRQS
jgi:hypothetical protein